MSISKRLRWGLVAISALFAAVLPIAQLSGVLAIAEQKNQILLSYACQNSADFAKQLAKLPLPEGKYALPESIENQEALWEQMRANMLRKCNAPNA